MYSREEKLDITNRIGVTKKVDEILAKAKKESGPAGQKFSKSKIVCNLVIKEYGDKL